LLAWALEGARGVCGDQVLVVTGAAGDAVEEYLDSMGTRSIHNPRWGTGIGSSLAAGLAALPTDCEAVLIMLADQPAIGATELSGLADRWRRNPQCAIASRYAGTIGVPAILPARLFGELEGLHGDRGAKAILEAQGSDLEVIDLPAAAFDLDRMESCGCDDGVHN
jgi:CTP:molybdopterin cytidylyltransferase MocA